MKRAAVFALVFAVPLAAGAAAIVESPEGPQVSASPVATTAPVYQLRCWQYGRLLFEEYLTELPPDWAERAVKIRGKDRSSAAVYVADTPNATCLLRAADPRDRTPNLPY